MKHYIIGYHGCSPDLKSGSIDDTRYFVVPPNATIIFFNNDGVLSRGDNNIPFVVNLYNTNRALFDYIFDKYTYGINLDKANVESYRHPDFFKNFPFYSSFNYLCNFEMYPSGSTCPEIQLFPSTKVDPSDTFF
jgi:hypothetical protein